MSEKTIERVKKMEELLDKVTPKVNAFEESLANFNSAFEDLKVLNEYYKKEWKEDYEADEQGKIPKDLKRGVLSQDTLFNLLEKVNSMEKEIAELNNKIKQLH